MGQAIITRRLFTGTNLFNLLTIPATYVDSTLTNFPMTVRMTPTDPNWGLIGTSGTVYFTDLNDVQLDHEVESVDANFAIYHVRVPSISSSVSTQFKMKFDGEGYTNGHNRTSVWDSSFMGVWHLGVNLNDSTSNNRTLTAGSTTTVRNGPAGPERVYNGSSGGGTYVTLPHSNTFTTSVYMKSDTAMTTTRRTPYYKLTWSPGTWMSSTIIRPHYSTIGVGGSYYDYSWNSTIAQQYNYFVYGGSSTGFTSYNNGNTLSASRTNWGSNSSGTNTLYIGAENTASEYAWFGSLKEFRHSTINRGAAWQKAEYEFLVNNRLIKEAV